jgi:protocatechuate 3,4-dioxygenase beta subunit
MRRLTVLLIGAGLVVGLGAQSPATPGRGSSAAATSGLIVGRVVDATTDAPIANVIVALAGAPLDTSIRVLTDSQGRFLFRNVPKGSFTLRASIGGTNNNPSGFFYQGAGAPIGPYLTGGLGQRRPGGLLQSIDVDDGARIGDVVIRLWKGASIDGAVVDEAGEPLVDVFVAAARPSSDGRLLNGPSTRTDDRGAYHFGTLVPGDYVIVVPQVLAAMPSATMDTLATTQDRPMSAKLANTMAPRFDGGITVGGSVIGTATWSSSSAIVPAPRGDSLYVYQTTFAPSATTIAPATTVTVRAGEERMGVNVSMQPVRAVAVSGSLVDDLGPIPNFGIRLMPRDAGDGSGVIDVGWTSTDARGRFTFPLVPPGAYRVTARRAATTQFGPDVVLPPPGAPRAADRVGASAQQDIAVGDRDLADVSLQLRLGVQVSAHLEFRGSGNRPPADRLRQLLAFLGPIEPTSRSLANIARSARVDANDNVVFSDISPGRYLLSVNDMPGVTLLGVSIDGRPVTDRAIVIGTSDVSNVTIELTDQPAEVTGTVRTRTGSPDPDAGVLLFSTDRSRWREARFSTRMFRAARVSTSGTFSLQPVLPGEYFIAAVPDDATADFPDTKFLEALAAVAQTVRVGAGAKPGVTLTTADVRFVKAPSSVEDVQRLADTTAHGPFADPADATFVETVRRADRTLVRQNAADRTSVRATYSPIATSLSGVVTNDETPARALRHAIVTATAAEIASPRQVVTDDDGRFAFPDLPPGRYSLVAEKAGYVKTYYGSKRPGRPPGTPVAVLAGQPAPSVVIRVLRGAVIAGTVRDQFGMPVSSSQVSVKQSVVVSGRRRMIDVPNVPVPLATTDDKGRYRIYGLPPGEYTVFCSGAGSSYVGVRETNSADVDAVLRELRAGGRASGPPGPPSEPRQVLFAGGYLPGVPDAESAQLVTLAAGEERTGADIVTRPLRSLRVEGIALGPGGTPMRNVMVAVVNTADDTVLGHAGVISPGADGRFVLPAVPPGRYAIAGRAAENGTGEGASMPYFADAEFVVNDQDVSGIVLQFERGVSITGRVVPPAGAAAADVARVRLGMTPVDSYASFVPARVIGSTQPDGTFIFDGIGPGKWRVTAAALPTGWSLRSAVVAGRDTLDVPLDVRPGQPIANLTVTMTNRPTELTGTVSDAAGQPTSQYSMVGFSTDRSLWLTAPRRVSGAARLSSDGRYRITGLPPGDYYLAALGDFDPAQLGDPSFLESLVSSAVKVTLGEGERKVQDFTVRGTSQGAISSIRR